MWQVIISRILRDRVSSTFIFLPFSRHVCFLTSREEAFGRAKNITRRRWRWAKAELTDFDRSMKIQKRGVVPGLQTDRRLLFAVVLGTLDVVLHGEMTGRIVSRRRRVDQSSLRKFAGNMITLLFLSCDPILPLILIEQFSTNSTAILQYSLICIPISLLRSRGNIAHWKLIA